MKIINNTFLLEQRKTELKNLSIDELQDIQVAYGLRDYKREAEEVNFSFEKNSLRELMTLDILVKEFVDGPGFIAAKNVRT